MNLRNNPAPARVVTSRDVLTSHVRGSVRPRGGSPASRLLPTAVLLLLGLRGVSAQGFIPLRPAGGMPDSKGLPLKLFGRSPAHLHVTPATPHSFIVHAFNDRSAGVRNSPMLYQAPADKGVPAGLYVLPRGKHAVALRSNTGSAETWTALCEARLKVVGFATDVQPARCASNRGE